MIILLHPYFNRFYAEIKKTMLTRSSFHYALNFSFLDISQTHLTHLPRCSLATTSPKFSQDLFCTIFIGHQATQLFITHYLLIIISGNM